MNHYITAELEERASLYALGALSRDESQAFEEHLAEGCATCRAELRKNEEVVGLLALSTPTANPPERVRGKLLGFLDQERADSPSVARGGVDPRPALTIRADEGQWQEAFQGIFTKKLFVDKERGTTTTLIRMTPGAQLPRHRHAGVEECFVLEGDVWSGELMLEAGDYHCAMPESVHERLTTVNGALFLIVGPHSYEMLERL